MAINTVELSPLRQKYVPQNLMDAFIDCNSSEPSTFSKRRYKIKKKKSPYLENENMQMFTQVAEKRFVERNTKIYSSFPLAANIYKANSAEFKAIKTSKKVKKPSSNAPVMNACTVSDMSNSEYFDHKCSEKQKVKKRMPSQARKYQQKPQTFQVFDRDARFELNCSSTDLVVGKKHGDSRVRQKSESDFAAQDVWAVLRNINQFQFNRIQQLSEDSIQTPKKKRNMYKTPKLTWEEPRVTRRNYKNVRKGRRLIETVRTEEMTYVANIEIEEQTASKTSISQGSSFDRVTVIDTNDHNNSRTKHAHNKIVSTVNRPKNTPISRLPLSEKINRRKAPKLPLEPPALAVNAQRAGQKIIDSSKNKFQRVPDRSTPRAKILNNQETIFISEEKSCGFISLNDSQDSSNCLREENESQMSMEKKLSHPNAMRDFIRRGFYSNANQNTDSPSIRWERKPKTVSKMTTVEIRKKLAQMKYPITILNKDELTSAAIEVTDTDPPQYYGLDKHVWPFMVGWEYGANSNPKFTDFQKPKEDIVKGRLCDVPKDRTEKCETDAGETTVSSVNKTKPKRPLTDKMISIFQKDLPTVATSSDSDVESVEKKTKQQLDINIQQMLRATEPHNDIKISDSIETLHRKDHNKNCERVRMPPAVKQPVNKAKETRQNLVDNVISKLKKGAYYSYKMRISSSGDVAYPLENVDTDKQDHKHAAMQTLSMDDVTSPDCNLSNSELCLTIPGFDESLPELEIQSLGFNQIAVKHCLTNVTLQFDVSVPMKKSDICSSSCCVPLLTGNSQPTVYKCSTTILNAALPAELCTLLPTLIKSMFDLSSLSNRSEHNMLPFINPEVFAKRMLGNSDHWMNRYTPTYPHHMMVLPGRMQPNRRPHLYGMTPHVPWFVSKVVPECPPFIISPELLEIMKGRFALRSVIQARSELDRKDKASLLKVNLTKLHMPIEKFGLVETNQQKLPVQALMVIVVDPRQLIMPAANSVFIDEPSENIKKAENASLASNCTPLQVYQAKEPERLMSMINFCDFRNLNFLKDIMSNYYRLNIHFLLTHRLGAEQIMVTKCKILKCNVTIKIQPSIVPVVSSKPSDNEKSLVNTSNSKEIDLVNISKEKQLIPVNSVYNCQEKMWVERVSKVKEQIKIFNEKARALLSRSPIKTVNTTRCVSNTCIQSTINAPKIQVQPVNFYTECKSTEDMTCLDKIKNTNDFIEALGPGRHFANVFDGLSETKLMLCVREMKNWIAYITSQQALLVLMLTSKKDSTKIMRLTPLVLQGIAMNRITRVTELDLEIEVLEKEEFQLPQVNAPTPALQDLHTTSITNQEQLLEELCWIAKNTASDNQRPLEGSSEQFLKSILLTRKNLTLPYLRVMARYIGLGLLIKNHTNGGN